MSGRLDQERERRLTPTRMDAARKELEARGYTVEVGAGALHFRHNGNPVIYHAYSGWASGKGIKDGRGLKRLLRQLDEANSPWQPIETAPTNRAVLIYIPNAEHYGDGIYRGMLVDMGTGKRWTTNALSMGRDCGTTWQPTHWMPLPPSPNQ